MQGWILFKELIATYSGLDRGALHVIGATLLLVALALVLKRTISSIYPWLALLVIVVLDEAVSGFADGVFDSAELAMSGHDLLVIMAVPTLLLLSCRFMPFLMVSRPPERRIIVPTIPSPYRERIVDVEYEEVK